MTPLPWDYLLAYLVWFTVGYIILDQFDLT